MAALSILIFLRVLVYLKLLSALTISFSFCFPDTFGMDLIKKTLIFEFTFNNEWGTKKFLGNYVCITCLVKWKDYFTIGKTVWWSAGILFRFLKDTPSYGYKHGCKRHWASGYVFWAMTHHRQLQIPLLLVSTVPQHLWFDLLMKYVHFLLEV